MDLIIHHAKCADGWCAAYVAKKKYPEATLMPVDYGMDFTSLISACGNTHVLMVDFSFPTREQNDLVAKTAYSFKILDHHKTAQVVLEGAPYAVFDMKRSGAGLTWDWLFGEIKLPIYRDGKPTGEFIKAADPLPRPWYVNYVEDRDLWNWKLPESREICAYLGTLPFTTEAWDKLRDMSPEEAAELGEGALAQIQHYVRDIVQDAKTGLLAGCKVAILNAPYLNCSEVGNELAKTHDISLTWFEPGDGTVQFSLRSIGNFDVSAVAKRFGGGGHKNAAGFKLSLLEGRKLIDQIHGRKGELAASYAEREPGGCV